MKTSISCRTLQCLAAAALVMVAFVGPVSAQVLLEERLVPAGAHWKYDANNRDLGEAWRDSDYDDSSWPSGPAVLGFGENDEATRILPTEPRQPTVYFRHRFDTPTATTILRLKLRLMRDDAAVVYLNGKEVVRDALPPGPVTFTTLALASALEPHLWYEFSLDPALLNLSGNVLAVEVHQNSFVSADLRFNLELVATRQPPTIPVVSLRATRTETREPLCDPAVCDAALPAPGVFVLSRDGGDISRELPVLLQFSGSASNGADYDTLPGVARIPAGQNSVELLVSAVFDQRSEGDEDVIAMITPDPSLGPIPRYVVNPPQSRARVVIHDNEPPPVSVVRIDAVDRIAEETSAPLRRLALRGRFVISRTGSTAEPLSIFVHYSGTATLGVDYPAQPFLVSIPAGTNALEIEIVPKPDDVAEPIEIVEAKLSECPPETFPPLGIPCYLANIDPAHESARVFIRDDGITTATVEITQPRAGAEFPVGHAILINATAIDLDGAITRLEFFAGATLIGTSEILFIRAPDPGDPIVHSILWADPVEGNHQLTASGVNAAGERVVSPQVPIVVGATLPIISIEATRPETIEPSPTSRIAPAVFTLNRTGANTRPLRVFTHYGGTATPDADYAAVPQWVEFPAGTSSVQVVIVPFDDDLIEGDETVIAEIVPPLIAIAPYYRIDPLRARARVVIHDNDGPISNSVPVVSIVATQPVTSEGCPTCLVAPGVFTLKRAGGDFSRSLSVSLRIGGTATPGVDYRALPEFATFPAGSETQELLVLPHYDTVFEGDETVTVQVLPDPSLGPIERYRVDPAHSTARVIIHDSPTTLPEVSIVAIDPFAREGTNSAGELNTATFSVRRRGPTNDVLEVALDFGGTARHGVDYETVPTVARIPAGRRSVRLTLSPIDDREPERLETVLVTLRQPTDATSFPKYTLGFPHRAAALIVDNDRARPLCVRLPDGFFNVCVPVASNGCFRVEATIGLDRWTTLCDVPVNEGAAHFIDPDALQFPHRFYRLVPVECAPEE